MFGDGGRTVLEDNRLLLCMSADIGTFHNRIVEIWKSKICDSFFIPVYTGRRPGMVNRMILKLHDAENNPQQQYTYIYLLRIVGALFVSWGHLVTGAALSSTVLSDAGIDSSRD